MYGGECGVINKGLFTSTTGEWETPAWLFVYLGKIHHIASDLRIGWGLKRIFHPPHGPVSRNMDE